MEKLNNIKIDWRKALDITSDAIVMIDPECKIIGCNEVFCGLLNKEKKDIIGEKCHKLVHGKNKMPKQCLMQEARKQDRRLELEFLETHLKKYLHFSANTYFDDNNNPLYGVHIIRDITERKKLEEMKDNLIRDVSHSLRTPIAMAKMALNICENGLKTRDIKQIEQAKNIASSNLDRLQKDVDNILTISKLDKRVMMARNKNKKELSLRKIINEIIEEAQPLIQDKKLELKIEIPDEANKVLINESDLTTLLHNIIDNAVKFTEDGSISITSRIKGGRFELKIKDTGCGIAPEDKDKVFDRFYKRHPAVPGVGLGLSICKDITEIHRGKINVASKGVGKGTTVTITLPEGQS